MTDTPEPPPLFDVLKKALGSLFKVMDVWRNCGKVERAVATRVITCCSDALEILRLLAELAEKGPLAPYTPRRRAAAPDPEMAAETAAESPAAEEAPASEAPTSEAKAEESQAAASPTAEPQPAEPLATAPPASRRARDSVLPHKRGWLLVLLAWQISTNRAEIEAALVTPDAIMAMQASPALCRCLTTICHALAIDTALIIWPPGMGPKRHERTKQPRKKRGPSPAHRRRAAYYAMDVGRGPDEPRPRPPSPKLPLRYFRG
jgi:hypothetical protein